MNKGEEGCDDSLAKNTLQKFYFIFISFFHFASHIVFLLLLPVGHSLLFNSELGTVVNAFTNCLTLLQGFFLRYPLNIVFNSYE